MLYDNDNNLRDISSHNKKAEFNNRLKFVVSKQNSLNPLNSLMLHDREILFDDKWRILIISRVLTRLRLWWRVAFDSLRIQLFWRKVVGKSASGNPDWYCGWFWIHCSSKRFERMTREATDVCLRVLKESEKSRFIDSYSFRNSVLIISHITFRDCRVHIFSDNLSRNICRPNLLCFYKTLFLKFSGNYFV